MFSSTHASAMSSQWITLWSNLKLNKDTSVKEIEEFISRIAELVREHDVMYHHELERKYLLTLLIAKFNSDSPAQSDFASLRLKIINDGAEGFGPALVNGDQTPTHYAQSVENFMNFVQNLCARMLSKKGLEAAIAKSKNNTALAAHMDDSNPVLKMCDFHSQCKHDSSQCNVLKKQKKSGSSSKDSTSKDKTKKVEKGKAAKSSKKCTTCNKGNHALKDCPKVKEVFKGMAKEAISDGSSTMDTTESESPSAS
ncbi:hypothetical protein BJ741DRAFT_573746, partial [Chytriomyces cf. hyalinus JEL632]